LSYTRNALKPPCKKRFQKSCPSMFHARIATSFLLRTSCAGFAGQSRRKVGRKSGDAGVRTGLRKRSRIRRPRRRRPTTTAPMAAGTSLRWQHHNACTGPEFRRPAAQSIPFFLISQGNGPICGAAQMPPSVTIYPASPSASVSAAVQLSSRARSAERMTKFAPVRPSRKNG